MLNKFIILLVMCIALLSSAGTAAQKHPAGRAAIPDRVQTPYVGAITVDAATGRVLFEDHADDPGYPASVQKVMTLFI